MEEILRNDAFKKKIQMLTPRVRDAFLDSLEELFDQESTSMIDIIEDCRYDMQQTKQEFEDEAKELRAESRMLEERRCDSSARSRSRGFSRASSRTDSRLSYIDEQMPLNEYIALRKQGKLPGAVEKRSSSSLSAPDTNREKRRTPSPSARSTHSLPDAERNRSVEEESHAILTNMSKVDAQVEQQREKQQEALEMRKLEKRKKQQEKLNRAMELLDKALQMDKILAKDKEKQGQKIQEKLQEMKKRRDEKENTQESDPYQNLEKY